MMQPVLAIFIVQSLLFIYINGVSATLCEIGCKRVPKEQNFGISINKTVELNIDVGDCNATYSSEANCTSANSSGRCIPMCQPASFDMEVYNRRNEEFTVQKIKTCKLVKRHCQQESRRCQRISKILHFFPNSKYQTRVDVGECIGGCDGDDNGCMATRTISKSVEGPNGAIVVPVINACTCTYKKCYKVDNFKSYFNYRNTSNDSSIPVREEKLVNIGKCVGECSGVMIGSRCYPSDSYCLWFFPGEPAKCAPGELVRETYVDANNKVHNVFAISECGCRTG